MAYEVIALDLDGTLTNSQKVITEPTRRGLIELQKSGKPVVLASGRPINGVVYLAEELELPRYGGYTLSFNGARITRCSDGAVIRNQTLPPKSSARSGICKNDPRPGPHLLHGHRDSLRHTGQ